MPNYAIHDGGKVINVIVAESAQIAEEATGLQAIETEGSPWIDWIIIDGQWAPPQPFSLWTWNGLEWEAPTPQPGPAYYWDDETQNWIRPEIPETAVE